jgi:hypothetical protein
VNEDKPTWRIPVATRRAVIRVCIALAIADLVLQAVEVQVIHHSATVVDIIPPVLAVLSGLYYLRSTRGRS